MQEQHKKFTFSGSLARRILLICMVLLVLPLLLHTFFLYREEVLLQEKEVRLAMRGLGAQLAGEIGDRIALEWKVLDAQGPALTQSFSIQTMEPPAGAPDHFAIVSGQNLVIGKGGCAIVHPLTEIAVLKKPPFPIDLSLLGPLSEPEQWVEQFPIDGTKLTLRLGASSERIADLQWKQILFRIGSFLFFLVVVGGVALWWLYSRLARPLSSLQLTMERVAQGAVHSRYAPQMWGFEINAIGDKFNQTLDLVLEHQTAAEQERLEREKLAYELKVGHDIQESLFPKYIPTIQGMEITPGFLPSKEVGGDFFDVFPLSSGKVLLAIGDVSGKGISACLYSLGLRSSLRAFAQATGDVNQIARQANDLFMLDVRESGFFATLWMAICDQNHLSYASFGHPPALLRRKKELIELSTASPAIGLESFRHVETGSFFLEAGDAVLLYTDGVTEAHDVNDELYGMKRLKKSFLSANDGASILKDIQFFSQEAAQHDDIAFLFLQIPKK